MIGVDLIVVPIIATIAIVANMVSVVTVMRVDGHCSVGGNSTCMHGVVRI